MVALNTLVFRWSVSFELSFYGGKKPDLHTPLQETKEQTLTTFKIKKIWIYLQLLSSPFT